MVHKAAATHEIRAKFREQGGRTLREEGVLSALEGRSSLDEVLRVTHNEDGEQEQGARDGKHKVAAKPAAAAPTPAPSEPSPTPPTAPRNKEAA